MQTPKKVMIGAAVAASMLALSVPAIAVAADATVTPTDGTTVTYNPDPVPTITGTAAPIVDATQDPYGPPPPGPVPTDVPTVGATPTPVPTEVTDPRVLSPLDAVAIRTGGRVVLGDTKGTALVNSKIAGTITQEYDNGKVIWNPLKNEGHAVVGNNATIWSNAATELGVPTGDKVATAGGGSVQTFERGKIVSDSNGVGKIVK